MLVSTIESLQDQIMERLARVLYSLPVQVMSDHKALSNG
jgi:hypothetical protein